MDTEKVHDNLVNILRILSSPTNLKIIILLSQNEMSVGELARFLEKEESDISRRLKQMRKAGLLTYKWKRIAGKNVKYYRILTYPLKITIENGNISIEGARSQSLPIYKTIDILWKKPSIGIFVGRKKELKKLKNLEKGKLLLVIGIPGIGKTTLVSKYIHDKKHEKVLWHTITSSDNLEGLLKKFAFFLSIHGKTELQQYLDSPWYDPQNAITIAIEGLDQLESILVFDDFHKNRDPRITEMIFSMAKKSRNTRIIVISRKKPNLPTFYPKIQTIFLSGLAAEDTKKLLEKIVKKRLNEKEITETIVALKGHPLLIKWFAEITNREGKKKSLQLLRKGDVASGFWKEIFLDLSKSEKRVMTRIFCTSGKMRKEYMSTSMFTEEDRKAVYELLDKGFVIESESHILINELVHSLMQYTHKEVSCFQITNDYIRYLTRNPDPMMFLEAMDIAINNNDSDMVKKLVNYRNLELKGSITDFTLLYLDIIEKGLKAPIDIEAKQLLLLEKAIGLIFLSEFEKAKEIYEKVLPTLDEKKYPHIKAISLSRLIYLTEKNAMEIASEAINIASKLPEDEYKNLVYSYIYANLARYYATNQNWELAKKYGDLEFQYAQKCGSPLEYAHSYFHKVVYDGFVSDLPSSKKLREIRELLDYYGAKVFTSYVVLYEAASYLAERNYSKAVKLAKKYIMENIRYKHLPPPCDLYGIVKLVSVLKNKRIEIGKLEGTCNKKENISCLMVLAEILKKGMEKNLLSMVKRVCSIIEFVYLDKILEELPDKKRLIWEVRKKTGFV